MRTSAIFGEKNSDFLKFFVCLHEGGGSIFLDFVRTSFMDGPLRALQSRQSKPLPIFVSGKDVTKLLAIPKLESGKAYVYAEILVSEIDRWGIANLISAMYFDTTIK